MHLVGYLKSSHSSICHNSRRILLSLAAPHLGGHLAACSHGWSGSVPCSPYGNCGRQSGTDTALSLILQFCAVSIMSLVLSTHSFVHHWCCIVSVSDSITNSLVTATASCDHSACTKGSTQVDSCGGTKPVVSLSLISIPPVWILLWNSQHMVTVWRSITSQKMLLFFVRHCFATSLLCQCNLQGTMQQTVSVIYAACTVRKWG